MANYLTTDTDLTAVADAIRTKGGTSASLAFPSGFVDAIDAIETGGGGDLVALINRTATSVADSNVTSISQYLCYNYTTLESVSFPNVTTINPTAFQGCTGLVSASFPSVKVIQASAFQGCTNLSALTIPVLDTLVGTNNFYNCSKITGPIVVKNQVDFGGSNFYGCANLTSVDICPWILRGGSFFTGCQKLKTIILRLPRMVSFVNVSVFNDTPFAQGGTGGTIYIPKTYYDHLGDGTGLDLKSATNWSTIDGYGTITWAQIEGSIYETQYADGTPIT